MAKFALGLDYGTNSVRALVVDVETGNEVGTGVANYASGEDGVFLDPKHPHLARQHPRDYIIGFFDAVSQAISSSNVNPADIVGIGVDTTGSTPMPVNEQGIPLALLPEFDGNLNALAWLWKDHTAHAEAAQITELANKRGEPYLDKCGGTYSSEWFWSKILHCLRTDPKVFNAAHSWVEAQDCIPAWLCGIANAAEIPRGICAAGHKAMFHTDWGGLPSSDFLNALDPRLAPLRERLYEKTQHAGEIAGYLDPEIAAKSGLPPGIPVSVGAFDAHLGAVGSGIKPGTMVKIMGTSTCDIMIGDESTPDIPGVCGIVPGSVIPGFLGIEAGQSAVGDLFAWCQRELSPSRSHSDLNEAAARLLPGQSGLLALDWNNGNRTILVDPRLTGLIVGQTLHTTAPEIYRALIEATAFGARKIIERIEEYGVPVKEIVVCGGIAAKSPLTMQIYADVCNRPISSSCSDQTCALGAAIAGAVAGGGHRSFTEAIAAMTAFKTLQYKPDPDSAKTYDRLYGLYSTLHDSFGMGGTRNDLSDVMKELHRIREDA